MLSMIYVIDSWYQTRGDDIFLVRFHRTNYDVHEPLKGPAPDEVLRKSNVTAKKFARQTIVRHMEMKATMITAQ
jgi:hypothetical protein